MLAVQECIDNGYVIDLCNNIDESQSTDDAVDDDSQPIDVDSSESPKKKQKPTISVSLSINDTFDDNCDDDNESLL